MNNDTPVQDEINIWSQRDQLPTVPKKHAVFAALVCFLCALGIPLSQNAWFALGLLAVLFVYVALTARSPVGVTVILIATLIVTVLGGGFSTGGIFLAVIVGGATGAFLFTACKLPFFTLLLPCAAVGVAFVFVNDLRVALLALVFVPAALLLAVSTVRGANRTTAICCTAVGYLLALLTVLAVLIYTQTGSLTRDVIVHYIASLRDAAVQTFLTARDQALQIYAASEDAQMQAAYQQMMQMFSEEAVTDTVAQFFNLLPAIAVVICSITAFLSQAFLNFLYHTAGFGKVITLHARAFTMSPMSAVFYTVSFILMLFLPSGSLAEAVVQNITLILMPGLCLIGAQALIMMLVHSRGAMRVCLVLLVGMMLCCYTGGGLYILAMWGAYHIISFTIRQRMAQKLSWDDDGNDGD